MKILLRYFSLLIFFFAAQTTGRAQQQPVKQDSIVQLFGVVMTADSLRGIPSASIIVVDKGRGTITNGDGVFSIVVVKGDKITFSSVGFKDKTVEIPKNWATNEMSVIQLLVADTNYLPATILKPRPTREQFERDFVNNRYDDDSYEIARQNIDEQKRREIGRAHV